MRIIRYLARSINPLNILLFLVMVSVAVCIILPLMKMNAGYSLPRAKPRTVEMAEKPPEKSGNILPSDYTVIGEMNLFHPERRIPVDKKAEEIPKPELILYGTMVQDSVQYAVIEDKKNPKTTPGRGNRQTIVKKGEVIGGFVLTEIMADRIALTKGEEKMTVLLAGVGKRKDTTGLQQGTTPVRPAQAIMPGSPVTPSQTAPNSPFGAVPGTSPMQQMGGRPAVTAPVTPQPGTTPQALPLTPRRAGRMPEATGTTPTK
jgi:hypothetical protein